VGGRALKYTQICPPSPGPYPRPPTPDLPWTMQGLAEVSESSVRGWQGDGKEGPSVPCKFRKDQRQGAGKVKARCRQGGRKGALPLKNKTQPTHRPSTGPVLAQHWLSALALPLRDPYKTLVSLLLPP